MACFGRFPRRREDPPEHADERGIRARWLLAAERLASETEAFVLGHLAECSLALGGDVPIWAWTNLLAHGSTEDLRAEAGACGQTGGGDAGHWREARSYLAGEVLHSAELCSSLDIVQRTVLVPLELSLAASPAVALWRPNHWVAVVETTLASHQIELANRARECRQTSISGLLGCPITRMS